MGATFTYEKDGYLFETFIGQIEPWPMAKKDSQGNFIPLTIEEIEEWQENYRKEHPEVEQIYKKIREENAAAQLKAAENIEKIKKRIKWWDNHPFLKAVCKPFLPSYYRIFKESQDNIEKSKTKEEIEQEEFDLYFDIDKYLSEINWITIENENEIASQSGLYLFKSQGHDHIFFDLYELKEGEKLWKYYLEKLSKGWSDAKPICFHIVDEDEKLKKCLINHWYVFDDTNV
jgi:hypothetical protein